MVIAKDLMNIDANEFSQLSNVIMDNAPKNAKTPLYAAYAFDIEYLSPFMNTLNERIVRLSKEVKELFLFVGLFFNVERVVVKGFEYFVVVFEY